MNELNPEVFRQLQQVNWNDLGRRLTAYALRRAVFYGWVNGDSQLLAGRDFTIDDIVQHVILKTINGERKWDPERGPLFVWLKYQVRSVMDAWVKGETGKHEVSFGDDEDDVESIEKSGVPAIEDVKDEAAIQPEEALIDLELEQETKQRNSELVGRIFQAVADDPKLVELVDYVSQTGEIRPRFVAAGLGVPVDDINNRKKRFSRRLSQLQLPDRLGFK